MDDNSWPDSDAAGTTEHSKLGPETEHDKSDERKVEGEQEEKKYSDAQEDKKNKKRRNVRNKGGDERGEE